MKRHAPPGSADLQSIPDKRLKPSDEPPPYSQQTGVSNTSSQGERGDIAGVDQKLGEGGGREENDATQHAGQTSGTGETGGEELDQEKDSSLPEQGFGAETQGFGSQFDNVIEAFVQKYPPKSKGKGRAQPGP